MPAAKRSSIPSCAEQIKVETKNTIVAICFINLNLIVLKYFTIKPKLIYLKTNGLNYL